MDNTKKTELLEKIKEKLKQEKQIQDNHNQDNDLQHKLVEEVSIGIKDKNMDSTVLYVTSFAKDMYNLSGKLLIDTFNHFNPNNYLCVYYENMDFTRPSHQILPYDLSESTFLNEWLKENAKDIPAEYGGLATPENNPALFKSYFNKSASRWFRKIVAIDTAIKQFGHMFKYVVWIDADCYVRNTLPPDTLHRIFKKNDIIYHLGVKRREQHMGIESGIIGFKTGLGYNFMDKVANIFRTGHFRRYKRWDDGYVFREVVDEEIILNTTRKLKHKIKILDVVGHVSGKQYRKSEVIPHGPFRDYFVHDKGKHNELRGAKIKKDNYNKI